MFADPYSKAQGSQLRCYEKSVFCMSWEGKLQAEQAEADSPPLSVIDMGQSDFLLFL